MKKLLYPGKEQWDLLCNRPLMDRSDVEPIVRSIIDNVRSGGDRALLKYSQNIEGVVLNNLKVSQVEIVEADKMIPPGLKNAIEIARGNIEKFHSAQLLVEPVVEISEGVSCWRRAVAIDRVGLYIPGGSAPLFSTVLMLVIPAKLAGCKDIVICTPPGKDGKVNPVILYAASVTGATGIFKVGGAQAIAAMAFGTESIPRVYKIFGPGNQFVTKAKEMIQSEGIPIDLPAGPSELVIIGDKTSDPSFIAADLLSQAEHGTDSQVVLLSDNEVLTDAVHREIELQINKLPRKNIASASLENSFSIVFNTTGECIDFSNIYAPEHLIIATNDAVPLSKKVRNAGSVFLGRYSCESTGDYASGTNHTLPTGGYARSYSGVSVDSFVKKITFQEISRNGILNLGPPVLEMAEAELLSGHANAVKIRLKNIDNEKHRKTGKK